MNERIKELIERATEPPVFPANIGYFDREKFAELIVRDVCNKLEPVLAKEILEYYEVE